MHGIRKYFLICFALISSLTLAETKPRARDLGIPFDGTPGTLNAITDIPGVEVGHTTLISGEGKLKVGEGPVRTGVTAILPRGKKDLAPVFAAWFSLNGNGEMTGTTWVEESGMLEGPVMITNTHSVGVVRDAVIQWMLKAGGGQQAWGLPVVAETWDGWLNDINGFHVKPEHAFQAMENAKSGMVEEGNVGGGTGMICYEFKGGIGTSSRKVQTMDFTVGVLVQANFGSRRFLRIAGVPVGKEIRDNLVWSKDTGSIIIIAATDVPRLPHQLKRIARRLAVGLSRTGTISGNGSGDIFIAFSTANHEANQTKEITNLQMLPNNKIDRVFQATVESTEEAIINALIAAEDMTGIDDHKVIALPHDRLREILKKYNRVNESN